MCALLAVVLLSVSVPINGYSTRLSCAYVSMCHRSHALYHSAMFTLDRSKVRPDNVVLVHGEVHAMNGFRRELQRRVEEWPEDEKPKIYSPANLTDMLDEVEPSGTFHYAATTTRAQFVHHTQDTVHWLDPPTPDGSLVPL